MDLSAVHIRRHPEVAEGRVEDYTVLVAWRIEPAETEVNACLNNTGTAIWNLLERVDTVESMVHEICDSYNVEPSEAREQITELITMLASQGLVVLEDENGALIPISSISADTAAEAR